MKDTTFKVNGIGFNTDGSVVKPVRNIAKDVDKALRPSKSKGSVNMNPRREDCLGWYDKKQDKWVMAWEV